VPRRGADDSASHAPVGRYLADVTTGAPASGLAIGAVFAERYEIVGPLGRGGMGAVYRARDLALGEDIALKLLAGKASVDVSALLRFRQEVKLARRVTHPNVARVFDIGESGGAVYLTMELVEGETLRQRLVRLGPLGLERAVPILRAVGEGLRAAHAAGVVHRDLKPANVLIDRAERVVLTDFGIARSLEEASELTVGVVGTPSYMAPEQVYQGAIDARTDVYALGVLVHEVVTGRKLAGGELDASLPAPLVDLVRRCTAAVPEHRPSSVDEVMRGLEIAAGAPGEPLAARAAGDDDTVELPRGASAARDEEAASAPSTPTPTGLAVLPLRYRGPDEHAYVGDAMTEELVDVLARTRALRVFGIGATARFAEGRDPRTVGVELGASAVLDGTVQVARGRLRIAVRLLDAATGLQIWTDRFEGELGDLFELQEAIAHRVAEKLRLELTTLVHRGGAPAEAITLYLAARHHLASMDHEAALAAAEAIDRCHELAPGFAPGLCARASAHLRCWFFDPIAKGVDWQASARRCVARALEAASDLAEAHLVAAILSTQDGDLPSSARALARALDIAPTYADAHEYLGALECEAGRVEEGMRRLALVASLDPTLGYGQSVRARELALQGRHAECDALLDELDRRLGARAARLSAATRIRSLAWRGDRERLGAFASAHGNLDGPAWRLSRLYARALVGEASPAEARDSFARASSAASSPRFSALVAQLAAEVFGLLGFAGDALLHVEHAASTVLVDLAWMDRCVALDGLRAHAAWPELRRRVAQRAALVWA
jgi:serine/threonine-protein kinase